MAFHVRTIRDREARRSSLWPAYRGDRHRIVPLPHAIAGHFCSRSLETSAFNMALAWFGLAATATRCWSVSLTCRCRCVRPGIEH